MTSLINGTRSIWIPEIQERVYDPLSEVTEMDVAVVGGGITGLTTALSLLRAGLRVALIEADRIGCGSTGHATAKLTALHRLLYARLVDQFGQDTAKQYAAANQAGIEHVAGLVDSLQIDCGFRRSSAYTYTLDARRVDELRREADEARQAGLPASFTTETNLPFEVRGAVRVTDQAQFDPYAFCVGLGQAFVAEGGRIFEQTRATDVQQDNPCVVKTNRGDIHARHVVLATLIPFMDRGGFFVRTYPSRSYGIAARLEGTAPTGMYIHAGSPVRSIRPLADGQGIIVVGEDHKVGQDPDTTERYAALEAWTRENFSVRETTHRWSAQDYISADGLPFIGRLPLSAGQVMVVTGLNKWGLAMGAAAALILTDLIQDREHPWESVFDARRTNVVESAKSVVTEGLDAAKHFVGDHLKSIGAKRLEQLATGEGGIAAHRGKRIAAYREEMNTVHAVSPVCTHMGCCVQWNTAERSWDCPCHGSRFDRHGNVLQGPATKPLETQDVSEAE